MDHAYGALLGFHVLVGTIALASFWGVVLARKGGRLHRGCGLGFAVSMAITTATAVVLCLLLLADPLAARPPRPDMSVDQRLEYARILHQVGAGLLEVSLVTGALLQFGLRALLRRRRFTARDRALDLALAGTAIVAGLLLLALGFHPRLPFLRGHGYVVAIVGALEVRALLRRGRSRSTWIGEHLAGVMGAGAIAHGSLAVNVARHFTDDVGLMFLPAAPTVLLFAIAIRIIARRWRRKLDGAAERPMALPDAMTPSAVRV